MKKNSEPDKIKVSNSVKATIEKADKENQLSVIVNRLKKELARHSFELPNEEIPSIITETPEIRELNMFLGVAGKEKEKAREVEKAAFHKAMDSDKYSLFRPKIDD